jgi:hypothetical protein
VRRRFVDGNCRLVMHERLTIVATSSAPCAGTPGQEIHDVVLCGALGDVFAVRGAGACLCGAGALLAKSNALEDALEHRKELFVGRTLAAGPGQ